MPLTTKDLAPYERAARIYCGRLGLNPDDLVPTLGSVIAHELTTRPRWQAVAEQVVHLLLLMQSVREGVGIDVKL